MTEPTPDSSPEKPAETHIEPVESVVVVELGLEAPAGGWGLLELLERADGGKREVILVCRPSARRGALPPGWTKVIPLPEDEPPSYRDAKRLGVSQAAGDVIRIVTAGDLLALRTGDQQFTTEEWRDRLGEHGVARPDRPASR